MSERNNTIQENMESTDPFIRDLFTELSNRVDEYETEGTEKLSFSDIILPIVIMAGIILFLFTSMF